MLFLKRARLYLWIKYINVLERLGLYKRFPIHYIGGSEALPPPLSSDEGGFLLEWVGMGVFGVKGFLCG